MAKFRAMRVSFVFHGSAFSSNDAAAITLETNQQDAFMANSVVSAGNVMADVTLILLMIRLSEKIAVDKFLNSGFIILPKIWAAA